MYKNIQPDQNHYCQNMKFDTIDFVIIMVKLLKYLKFFQVYNLSTN